MNNLMKRIMSVAMAAITTTSPILSSYTIYASDITVNDDGTVTQMSTSTDSSMSEADETKFLFIKLKTAGGKVVLNEGEDQEQRIRLDKKTDGAEYIDVYDKNDVLISSESTKDNGYTYVYEAKIDDAVNVKAKADDGYTIKLYELTDDSSGTEIAEDVGFDAGNKVEAFKYPVFMEYDKTVKIGFERKESAEDIADDLSVKDETEENKSAKAEEATGKKKETEEEADASKPEALEAEHMRANGEAEDETSSDTKSEDTKKTEDTDTPEKSENSRDVDNNNKQDTSEETATDDDLTVNADGNKKDNEDADITVNDISENNDENADEKSEEKSGEGIIDNDEASEDTKDTGSDNPDETAVTTSEGAKVVESPAPDESSSNTDEDSIANDAKTEEADSKTDDTEDKLESDKQDTEQSYDISNLDSAVFSSARLVVISDDAESISDDSKYIIANYQNIYLIQYETVENAMKAYMKYTNAGLTAEPDAPIIAASQDVLTEDNDITITEGNNPISMLAEEAENATSVISNKKIIALLDTGTLESPNVISRISLIDDSLNGNGHGDEMVSNIVKQNPDAEIISIRIMGNDGKGTISSILAGMEYAIEQNVDIINLSLYAKATTSNSIIRDEIEKAVNNGIIVVAAAGNDGADVSGYIPGNVSEAWVIGACNVNGVRRGDSNYGKTVDYNVVANSTSEAAAKFSGYASVNDINLIHTGELIFIPDESETYGTDNITSGNNTESEKSEDNGDFISAASTKVTLKMNTVNKYYPPGSLCTNDWADNFTRKFEVTYKTSEGDTVTRNAYCLQGAEGWPKDGVYSGSQVEELSSDTQNKMLAKAIFYLYGGPAWGNTVEYTDGSGKVNIKNILTSAGCSTPQEYFAMSHYIGSYIYNGAGGKWNYNGKYSPVLSSKGVSIVQKIYNELKKMDFPRAEFSSYKLKGDSKFKTPTVTYKSIDENTATITLPSGVTLVNETTKKSSTGKATIAGGDKFHLEGDEDKVAGKTQSLTLSVKISSDFRAYVIHTVEREAGHGAQDIGYAEFGSKKLKMTVTWPEPVAGDKWRVRVQAKKIDEGGKGLAGAKFDVFDNEACSGDPVGDGQLVSKDDGMTNIIMIDEIPQTTESYDVWCKEVKAPEGYATIDKPIKLTFKLSDFKNLSAEEQKQGQLQIFGLTDGGKGIVNKKGWKIRVKLHKTDGKGKNLAGAIFGIYTDAECTNPIGEKLESGESGETNTVEISIDNDKESVTLYCKEEYAPPGFKMSDEILSITFNKKDATEEGELKSFGDVVNVTSTPTPKITPPETTPPSGGLYVKKTSKAPEEIMSLKSYTLANAEFKVTSSRDGDMGTLTTDESGYSNVLTLPDNSIPRHSDAVYDMKGNLIQEAKDWKDPVNTIYYIKEIKTPNYHKDNYEIKSQSVTMPDDDGRTFEIPFVNEPIFCDGKLDIEKLDVKGKPVVGAVFKIQYFDSDGPDENDLIKTWYLKSDERGHVLMDNNHLDTNNRSDDFFKYNGNIVIPIGGYIQITEVDAPAEYVVETEPVGIVTTKDADFKLTYDNAKAWYEELERCRINLKKYEADGKTPIAGVEFEIKFLKQAIVPTSKMHPNFKRLLKEGESTIRHTDENGDVFFDNLDQGTYQITEIKTLDGNSLLKEPIIVTVPMTMTEQEANAYGNVDFTSAKEDVNYSGKWYFYECLFEITNNATFKIPMTGDSGTWKYGLAGFGIVIVISTGFVLSKTKNKKTKRQKHKK